MKQEWYKSWALWLSMAALVVYVVKVTAKIDISPVVNGLMDVLLPVLVGFGVVNNPNVTNRWVERNDAER
jgi:hypothetical protein